MEDPRQTKVEATRAAIEKVAQVEASSLGRARDLSPSINFEAAVPYFERMLDVFRELGQRDIQSLPSL